MGRTLLVAASLPWLLSCSKVNPVWGLGEDGSSSASSTTAATSSTSSGTTAAATDSGSTTAAGTAGSTATDASSTGSGLDPCPGIDGDTVALYRFEDLSGGVLRDAVGNADGMLDPPALQLAAPGICGNALVGQEGVVGVVPDTAALDLPQGSIDVWIEVPDFDEADQYAVLSRDIPGEQDEQIALLVTSVSFGKGADFGHLVVRQQSGGTMHARCSGEPVATGSWIHVGLNFGAPDLELYIDGVLQPPLAAEAEIGNAWTPCNTPAFAAGLQSDLNWTIGGTTLFNQAIPTSFFVGGLIDELRISSTRRDFSAYAGLADP